MNSKPDNDNERSRAGHAPASGAPRGPITDSMAKPLIKRFYKTASVGQGPPYPILLDGRAVKTPAKRALALPTRALAEAVAAEWAAQGEKIDPSRMPLTRSANTAIDSVAENLAAVAADIVAYAGSDLLCYRADAPVELVARQAKLWNPVIAWARDDLGARFNIGEGVKHVAQPADATAAIAAALEPYDAFGLTALHIITTLTGSVLLALALARGRLTGDEAWDAAHVDEDFQISQWGEDFEAAARRKARRAEFDAASRLLTLVK